MKPFLKTISPVAVAASLTAACLLLPAPVAAQGGDHEAVDQVMRKLLRAFETGDSGLLFQTMRRDGLVLGYSTTRGQVSTQTAEEWSKGFTGAPAPDEAQRKRSYQILDVSAHAAVVKLTLDYPLWDGLDYLSLAKVDGEWKVYAKTWSGQRKPAPQAGG